MGERLTEFFNEILIIISGEENYVFFNQVSNSFSLKGCLLSTTVNGKKEIKENKVLVHITKSQHVSWP